MTPRSSEEACYKSKYWPRLNGAIDEASFFTAPWERIFEPAGDRENILLDIIGAYDLLRLQGLTVHGATTRLGLHKSRDELVQELDLETARRLSSTPAGQSINSSGSQAVNAPSSVSL